MNEYYLTENLRLKNYKLEYKNNKDEFKIVNKRDWHLKLNEYGWEKLSKSWIKKLNKLSIKKEKNSLFGVLDCESDGDCLFHCICHSLNEKNILNNENNYYNSSDIRKIISDNLSDEDYHMIINYYRIMEDKNDFEELWNPYEIDNINDFKKKINECSNNYWCDYLLLQILIKLLNINIFILNSSNDCTIYNTLNIYNPNNNSIFIVYENECHFKLLGYFTDRMISYFTDKNIPIELRKLFNLN